MRKYQKVRFDPFGLPYSYDNLGNQVTVDVYATKTAAENWQIAIYNQADADPTSGGFPYANAALVTNTLVFDPTTGQLDAASPTSLDIPIPNGGTVTLDMSQSSQLAASYTVLDASVNGNAPAYALYERAQSAISASSAPASCRSAISARRREVSRKARRASSA